MNTEIISFFFYACVMFPSVFCIPYCLELVSYYSTSPFSTFCCSWHLCMLILYSAHIFPRLIINANIYMFGVLILNFNSQLIGNCPLLWTFAVLENFNKNENNSLLHLFLWLLWSWTLVYIIPIIIFHKVLVRSHYFLN